MKQIYYKIIPFNKFKFLKHIDYEFKIIFVGNPGTGTCSLIQRFA